MIKRWITALCAWLFGRSVVKTNLAYAKAEADRRRQRTNKKQLVFLRNGQFEVCSKERLKKLHRSGAFKPGLNLRQLEAMAVYRTH